MPKRQLNAEYTEWVNALPENQRQAALDAFLNSRGADHIFNLQAEFTRSTQRSSEFEKRAAAAEPYKEFVEKHIPQKVLNRWPDIAQVIRDRDPDDIIQLLQGSGRAAGLSTPQQRQVKAEIDALLKAGEDGEIPYTGVVAGLQKIAEAVDHFATNGGGDSSQFRTELQNLRRFQERDVPTYVANIEKQNQELRTLVGATARAEIDYNTDATEYKIKYPARDLRRIKDEFLTNNHQSFADAAAALYGEEDQKATVEEIVQQRLKEEQEARKANGEEALSEQPGFSPGMRTYQRSAEARQAARFAPREPLPQNAGTAEADASGGRRVWQRSRDTATMNAQIQNILKNGVQEAAA